MGLLTRREALVRTAGLAAAATASRAFAAPLHDQVQRAEIDRALQAKVDTKDIPGVVAIAADERSVLYEGTLGYRNMAAGVPMSRDSIFRIASMVKLLTSVAALQLVEQEKLGLDEPAGKVDPELAAVQLLTGFNAKGVPELRTPHNPITLRQLLSHTSGFSYPLWDSTVVRYLNYAHHHHDLPRRPLVFEPGTRWAYGGSLDYVGRMVEIASGQRLDRYFRDHITGPLGMRDTVFAIDAEQRGREASLHVRENGRLVPQPLEKPATPTSFSGGGGIYSTAPDYLVLLQALLNGGELGGVRILRAETVARMGRDQIGDLDAGILRTTNPALSNDVDFFPGKRLRWGLGHMINRDPIRYGRSAGSLTWAGLFNTYYWIDPSAKIAAVIMMQILPFADTHALAAYRQFEHGVYHAFKAGLAGG